MRRDRDRLNDLTQQHRSLAAGRERARADVCVIGAGFAGLIAATRIAEATKRPVVVVESGGAELDARLAALDTIDRAGGTYGGSLRQRGPGGTSALWAGKLLPLTPCDMADRVHIGLERWPLDVDALARYTPAIEAMLGVAPGPYDGDIAVLDPAGRLPRTPEDLVWRWPKHPARERYRIDHALGEKLATLPNLSVWTDATTTTLTVTEGRLVSITAANHMGGELVVEADRFVIAAGTLETTRLLLAVDASNDGIISRTTDALGRYFNEHFGFDAAVVRPCRAHAINRTLADRTRNGTKRHLHGELDPAIQAERSVASAYFDIASYFPADSSITSAKAIVDSLRDRRIRGSAVHLGHVARSLPGLGRALYWKGALKQQYWPPQAGVYAKIWFEQLPRYTNRLTLGERRDALGQPVLSAHVGLTSDDERTARTMTETLRRFWDRYMVVLADLDWALPASGRLIDAAVEQAHPAGSTRMGRDPARSVVDGSLRMHTICNVHVASASVFPSSGSANPTLTIMQLAMLAADAVIRDCRAG